MVAADVPKWGFGQEPMQIKPVPADFIPHFATTGDSRIDASKTFLKFADFAFKPSLTRPPAWERVPTRSLAAPTSNRQIMRRVTVSNERQPVAPFVIFPNVSAIPVPDREEIGLDLSLPRKLQRGQSYQPASSETGYEAKFMLMFSHAQHLHEIMTAKVGVVNSLIKFHSGHTREDMEAIDQGIARIIPVKRAARLISTDLVDTESSPLSLVPARGNRLMLYDDMLHKIQAANRSGKESVDLSTASIADVSTALQNSRRDPRKRLAALGEPELSVIMDEDEPESPTIVREPVLFPGSRSPSKRLARLLTSKAIKKGVLRLSGGFTKLLPGSPSKSPGSPSKSSPPKSKRASSPLAPRSSPIYGSAAVKDNMSTESVADSPTRPGRTFRVPSECDSSSFEDTGLPETPHKSSSPVMNYSRPIAPTPSQWNRPEPSTPATPAAQSAPFNPVTPQQTDSPIGLAALLPAILPPPTPQSQGCKLEAPSVSLEFGNPSPFGSNNSWLFVAPLATESNRIKTGNQARRRRSEPLLRKFLDTRARRLSASPQKVQFQQEAIFNDDISIASLFDITIESPTKVAAIDAADETSGLDSTISPSNEPAADSAAEHTLPLDTIMEESVATTETDPIEAAKEPTEGESNLGYASVLTENLWLRDLHSSPAATLSDRRDEQPGTEQPPTTVAESPVTQALTSEGVVNIDVRENPDIFGAHLSSPPAPTSIQNLSRMADDACNGHAKVVVTEENGRLFVRFKLSARYAHMFPASQGFNDTLSLSPSVDISTPRPRPVDSTVQTPDVNSFGDFASPSPSVIQTPEPQSTESLLKTPDISGVGVIDRSSPGEFDTPELPQNDNTLVFGEPATIDRTSSIRHAPRRQSEMTPLKCATRNAMGISKGPATPQFATPAADQDCTLTIPWDDETPAQQVDTPAAPPIQEVEAAPAANNGSQDLDSPNRDYLRAFINQNRRTTASAIATLTAAATANGSSTTSATNTTTTTLTPAAEITPAATTTEAGSPIAPVTKRQPLGARSPNRGSPMKAKRKHDGHVDTDKSPAKKVKTGEEETEAAGSIRKVSRKTKAKRQKAELAIDMTDLPSASSPATTTTTSDIPNSKQVDELATNASTTRRSSRLRSQEHTSGAPKSSLPTPIKLGRAGAGRSLPKKARSEEDELARKTRANTKRNMGKAEFPAEVLVRIADEAEKNSDQVEESEKPASGRRVGWNQPLEKVQGEEPKKGRPKSKATQGQTGISKPKAKRATKVAADLGMVANGTPAKPQRVTRSSARSRV
ncbi:hypothetical protein FGADI_10509 [Fusarium gaditjirri]|uniref:Uncharacterized protein n=1 Tax=Fusarium gaditjirri TaxID=282569 RepID=A0A8H4WRK1_9HYPO|nr:hypothetical protein FGADI_10509 [Fusarium gaditjirri]